MKDFPITPAQLERDVESMRRHHELARRVRGILMVLAVSACGWGIALLTR